MRVIIPALLALSACATLPEQIEESIRVGDGYSHVKEVLGEPRAVGWTSDTAGFALYRSRKHSCLILLERGHVTEVGCEQNADYVNPVAAMLQGAGQGLMHAHDNDVTCTDYGNGQMSCYNRQSGYTNCTRFGNTLQCH